MVRTATLLLGFLLASCSETGIDAENAAVVSVVDHEGRPVADAVVWSMPRRVWEDRSWIVSEHSPFSGNPHELLRRLGTTCAVAADGTLRVPRGTVLAGEGRGLAGMTTVAETRGARDELLLTPWRWTIVVRDEAGSPVAGVPVACSPEERDAVEQFEGIPLGLTGSRGQLVVRDPASVRLASYVSQPVGGPDRGGPQFVSFEVDGMYLRPHAEKLPYVAGTSGTVTLVMPPVTKIEVQVRGWGGVVASGMEMTRVGKSMQWDGAPCWVASGRHHGLVGAPNPIVVGISGSTIRSHADVPRLPAGESFVVAIDLEEDDVIVRARLRDAEQRQARHAVLRVLQSPWSVRTRFVRADADGNVALVFAAGVPGKAGVGGGERVVLVIESAPIAEHLNLRFDLRVEEPVPGQHRDLGVIDARDGR